MIGCLRERCSVMRHARLLVPGLTLWALLAPARLWAMADESPQIESEAVPAQQEASFLLGWNRFRFNLGGFISHRPQARRRQECPQSQAGHKKSRVAHY